VVDPTAIPEPDETHPKQYTLDQNYPNPFNPTTNINYELPITSEVQLEVYKLLGQMVAILVSERQETGYYQIKWDASGYAGGIYSYRLSTKTGFSQSKKLVLLK
jgi:hypothetical protein